MDPSTICITSSPLPFHSTPLLSLSQLDSRPFPRHPFRPYPTNIPCSCLTTGFLGFDLKNHKATIYDSGDTAFSSTTRAKTGEAVAAVLKNPEQTANKYLYISSFETTPNKVLASLEKNSGQKFTVEHVKSDEMITKGREELKAGNMMGGMAKLLLSSTFKGGLGADFAKEESLSNDLLGLKQEDLDSVTKRVLETGE